jgi:hypothetical protein
VRVRVDYSLPSDGVRGVVPQPRTDADLSASSRSSLRPARAATAPPGSLEVGAAWQRTVKESGRQLVGQARRSGFHRPARRQPGRNRGRQDAQPAVVTPQPRLITARRTRSADDGGALTLVFASDPHPRASQSTQDGSLRCSFPSTAGQGRTAATPRRCAAPAFPYRACSAGSTPGPEPSQQQGHRPLTPPGTDGP